MREKIKNLFGRIKSKKSFREIEREKERQKLEEALQAHEQKEVKKISIKDKTNMFIRFKESLPVRVRSQLRLLEEMHPEEMADIYMSVTYKKISHNNYRFICGMQDELYRLARL